MTVDAEVQRLIDAGIAPVVALVQAQGDMLDAHDRRIDALEGAAPTPVPPTPEPTPTPTNPSGQAPPSGDLPGWKLVLVEDFNKDVPIGGPLATTFPKIGWYPPNYFDTTKKGQYNAATTVSTKGGVLTKHIHTLNGRPQVAAMVPYIRPPSSTEKWPGQIYGRYAVRVRFLHLIPGYKVAWLLWPDSGTNTTGSPSGVGGNGEIDMPEHSLNQAARTSGFMHRQDATLNNDQYAASVAVNTNQWHTYVIEWSKDLCRFLIDDVEFGRTTSRVPYTAMHWVMQTETELTAIYPAPSVAGDVEIDWVAAWAKA